MVGETHALFSRFSRTKVKRTRPRDSHTNTAAQTPRASVVNVASMQLAPTSRIVEKREMLNQPFLRWSLKKTPKPRKTLKMGIWAAAIPRLVSKSPVMVASSQGVNCQKICLLCEEMANWGIEKKRKTHFPFA